MLENILYALLAAGVVLALIYLVRTGKLNVDKFDNLPLDAPPGFTGLPLEIEIPAQQQEPFILRDRIYAHAVSKNLDPSIVWGVVITESSGDPNAVNPSDPSAGLMQVTPLIGRSFASLRGTNQEVLSQLLDPETNLVAGTGFLAHLKNRYAATHPVGEWVQAYNVGETLFDRGIRNDLYGDRVLKNAASWKG